MSLRKVKQFIVATNGLKNKRRVLVKTKICKY